MDRGCWSRPSTRPMRFGEAESLSPRCGPISYGQRSSSCEAAAGGGRGVVMESRATGATASAQQARAIGAGIAPLLSAGDVVLLVGSLGAGKTTFVQGLVAALGGREPVTSPTFTLAHKYRTSPPVTHVDLWRLGHLQEVVDLALEEELDEGGVVIVEWGEAAEPD